MWLFFLLELGRAEEFPKGVLIFVPGNLSDQFAEAIPFRNLQKFSVTVTVFPNTGGSRVIKSNLVKAVQYFAAPHGDLASQRDHEVLKTELRNLQSLIDKYPGAKTNLESIKGKYLSASQMLANGYVRYNSQWIPKTDFDLLSKTESTGVEGTDIVDLKGNLYPKAKVVNVVHNGIVIRYSSGVRTIPFTELDQNLRTKYQIMAPSSPARGSTAPILSQSNAVISVNQDGVFLAHDKNVISSKFVEGDTVWKPSSMDDAADCVVLIEGDAGSGTGFLVSSSDKSYIYTNAHVVAGNKQLKMVNRHGDEFFDVETTELAGEGFADGDILRFKLKHRRKKGLILDEGTINIADGEKISAIGNSHGAGVIKILDGEVTGLGPDRLEISSGIVQGNSGGPIVHAETFTVVGVSTFAKRGRDDIWSKGTGFDKVRRFGLRPRAIRNWDRIDVRNFMAEAEVFRDMKANVRLIHLMKFLEVKIDGVYFDRDLSVKGEYVVGDILDEYKEHIIVKNIFKLNKMLKDSGSANGGREAMRTYGRFLVSTRQQMSDLRAAQEFSNWSFYHRNLLSESNVLVSHEETEIILGRMIKTLGDGLR
ncbi:MAG: serine protease [Verrucomicrobiales bacterium]|nr:serine protease [Verrucomicrobiales bacterium]